MLTLHPRLPLFMQLEVPDQDTALAVPSSNKAKPSHCEAAHCQTKPIHVEVFTSVVLFSVHYVLRDFSSYTYHPQGSTFLCCECDAPCYADLLTCLAFVLLNMFYITICTPADITRMYLAMNSSYSHGHVILSIII